MNQLGKLETLVIAAVLSLGEDAYAVPVHNTLLGFRIKTTSGSLYTTLDRLDKKGLLSSRFSDPFAQRGGRSRRYFKLTGKGRRALADSIEPMRLALEAINGMAKREGKS